MTGLVNSLSFIGITFTEPCCKGRRFSMGIQVGNITKRRHSKVCDPLSSFLCVYCCHRRGRCTHSMPQHHGGHIQKMAQQYTFQPKMTENANGIIICMLRPVKLPFPFISMLLQKLIKCFHHPVIFFLYMSLLHHFIQEPLIIPKEPFICRPVLGQPVPGTFPPPIFQIRP